ncbi:glycosyltransferase family 2 protein [Candidatus Saccharibacteria bacterium]|nr:glycosyltransferase family 2 protein [Candidatus Saccharibacteria bacterium]
MRKKVSVILPNYNYSKYLKSRLSSILSQTYPLYELIILDDASTDDSIKIIESLLPKIKENYPALKISFLKNEQNSGKAILQWQKGFELATGDYIWIAEADDLSNKNFLEEAVKGFDDPKVVLSYTESKIINRFGLVLAPNFRFSRDKEKTGHYKNSYVKTGREEIEEIMAIRCTIPNVSAVLFLNSPEIPYKEIFKKAASFSQVGDWYFYAKILEHGKISYNHKSLNKFRIHKGSKTANSKKDKKHYQEVLALHQLFLKQYNLSDIIKKRILNEEKRISKNMV